jgi:hypothetical protein
VGCPGTPWPSVGYHPRSGRRTLHGSSLPGVRRWVANPPPMHPGTIARAPTHHHPGKFRGIRCWGMRCLRGVRGTPDREDWRGPWTLLAQTHRAVPGRGSDLQPGPPPGLTLVDPSFLRGGAPQELADLGTRSSQDSLGEPASLNQITARRAYSAKGEDLPVEVLEGSLTHHLLEFNSYQGCGELVRRSGRP